MIVVMGLILLAVGWVIVPPIWREIKALVKSCHWYGF